ncbi:MAG: hypothetical protein EOO22_02440 [Comamonadaceae bacterium]|nr:MAG: hypothetical protein EOO22_02440 [Comamonadaceae bacterium]
MKRILASLAIVLALSGCAVQPRQSFEAFNQAAPRSILVVPLVNKSLDVDAADYMLSTLTVPLAERGYYVFPVHTTKVVLEQEGLYEAEQVHNQPPDALAKLFGADAVLYVTINRWDAQYLVFQTTVTVELDYRMVAKDGTQIWKTQQAMQYTPQHSSGGSPLVGLVVAAITAAVERAAPNYMPLAVKANEQALLLGPQALPLGPYRLAAKP